MPAWEISRQPKELTVCSGQQSIIGSWHPFLRAFTQKCLQLRLFPLSFRVVGVSAITQDCISQGLESHSLRGGQGVCLPDAVRGDKWNFDYFQLADTTGQITLHWPTLCSFSLPDSTEPLLTPLPAPSFSISNAQSPLYKSNWVQPCSLFPTAMVYYLLKSVLITLTRFWLCVYSTFNTHPDNLMHMHIYAYTNTTMGPPGLVQLTPSYQQSSSAFFFRNWHPSSSSGQWRPPTHQPGLRKCLISDLLTSS